jgi:hypothetical protein
VPLCKNISALSLNFSKQFFKPFAMQKQAFAYTFFRVSKEKFRVKPKDVARARTHNLHFISPRRVGAVSIVEGYALMGIEKYKDGCGLAEEVRLSALNKKYSKPICARFRFRWVGWRRLRCCWRPAAASGFGSARMMPVSAAAPTSFEPLSVSMSRFRVVFLSTISSSGRSVGCTQTALTNKALFQSSCITISNIGGARSRCLAGKSRRRRKSV